MRKYSTFIMRNALWVVILGSLLSIIGGYYTVLLYKNLRTDFEELLPKNARSVIDLNKVSNRLESTENILILAFSDNTQASKKFVDDLAPRIAKLPKDIVSSVEHNVSEEIKFFKQRQPLFLEVDELKRVKAHLKERIMYERWMNDPLHLLPHEDIPKPKTSIEDIEKKYKNKNEFGDLPGGYYATPDEKVRGIIVYMPGKASEVERAKSLRVALDKEIEALNPASYSPDLKIRYTGNIQNMLEEQAALLEDLELSTVIVMVLIFLAMYFYYGNLAITNAVLIALFYSTFWTFGISYFLVGYLNANSAFLASIILGNGINFGIILTGRYVEERRNNRSHNRSLLISMQQTVGSTLTAALGASIAYGSLMMTSFQGFSQFGVIGFIGMILCWIGAFTLLPAFMVLFHRIGFLKEIKSNKLQKFFITDWIATAVEKKPKLIWNSFFAITIISLITFVNFNSNIIEGDFENLRDKRSLTQGSGSLYHYIVEICKRYPSPIVAMPDNKEDVEKVAKSILQKKEQIGESSLITDVKTIRQFVPDKQEEKIALLKEIQSQIPKQMIKRLPKDKLALYNEFTNENTFKTFTADDIPELIKRKFREKDGTVGRLVLIDKKIIQHEGIDNLLPFIKYVREATEAVAPNTPIAGQVFITGDMVKAVLEDGPRVTLIAFGAVIILVSVMFRHFSTISSILTALVLGVTWLMGIILSFKVKINFLNFIALPITFGIGVDYGVNMFQRYREEGSKGILNVIRNTGGAVFLCSLTTIIGYSSLLIAGNQAFVSFGLLAVLGEITTVLAAIMALPAYLLYRDSKNAEKKIEKSDTDTRERKISVAS